MGCCSSRGAAVRQVTFESVRVVTINGHVEDFEPPVTAGQVTGKPPSVVLCTRTQLLTIGSQPLRPADILVSGQLYFLLPPSVWESTPIDLANLVSRLTNLAQQACSGTSPAGSSSRRSSPLISSTSKERSRSQSWAPELHTIEEMSLEAASMRESPSDARRSRRRSGRLAAYS